jgi:hypothetical protein
LPPLETAHFTAGGELLRVGTDHPVFCKEDAGTNLDQCRSDAVDQSRNCQTIFHLANIRGIEFGYTISFAAFVAMS